MIHIYCGDGKGKTSAAIGLSVRASGQGYKVIFTQFLKCGLTGELQILQTIPTLTILRSSGPAKFSFAMTPTEKAEALVRNNSLLKTAFGAITLEKTLLVLDEAVGAINVGLLDKEPLLQFLQSAPTAEVVLTGRNPSSALLDLADYVSELTKIKHPYDKGISARKGIEF